MRLIAYAVGDTNAEDVVKSYRKELWFNIPGRRAFINITPQVEAAYAKLGSSEGLCLPFFFFFFFFFFFLFFSLLV